MDATNATVTFTAPASGNVIVVCTVLAGSAGYMGIREGSTDLIGPQLVTSATGGGIINMASRAFYITGVSPGSHTYKLAIKDGTWYHGPTYGMIEMTVWEA